ncbi:MAG: heterocyst development glycosyltransferase HepC [Cyanobacteria bacterium P01_E01_bin.35]
MKTSIIIQTSKILTLDIDPARVNSYLPFCNLKWRQKNLLVNSLAGATKQGFPALTRKEWIENCLRNSWIKRVCIDRALGDRGIKLWADACHQASKPIFVRIPSNNNLPSCSKTNYWRIKRVLDWIAALILLVLISPMMFLVTLVIKIFTPGPIFYCQWRVGERGRLFRVFKFRTMKVDAELQHHQLMTSQNGLHKLEYDPRVTSIGKWLRKYSLDELPQLLNVLRGEMSLVGPRPWALYDALRLGSKGSARLNALPGITGAWQVESRSHLLDLEAVTIWDLDYLNSWSLAKDLKILLLTVPRVLSGFGAY